MIFDLDAFLALKQQLQDINESCRKFSYLRTDEQNKKMQSFGGVP